MDSLELVSFTKVQGNSSPANLKLFALSTCAFCEKAMNFLKNHAIPYEYLFLDLLDYELKKSIKSNLREQFGNTHVFPLLMVNNEKLIAGFVESDWLELLNK